MIGRTLAIGLIASSIWAQETLTLEQAVQTALQTHPVLNSARETVVAAQQFERQARLTFNPRLNLQVENLRIPRSEPFVYSRDTDNFAFLQQTFETAGKRGLRGDVAAQQVRRSELELQVLERGVRLAVTEAWWRGGGARWAPSAPATCLPRR